jgi:prevent-host-death family protein
MAAVQTTYSTYEAKAKLSQILRRVRGGQRVFISHRGVPIAEVRPLAKESGLAAALADMEEAGLVTRAGERPGRLASIARRRGALARFLASRE